MGEKSLGEQIEQLILKGMDTNLTIEVNNKTVIFILRLVWINSKYIKQERPALKEDSESAIKCSKNSDPPKN